MLNSIKSRYRLPQLAFLSSTNNFLKFCKNSAAAPNDLPYIFLKFFYILGQHKLLELNLDLYHISKPLATIHFNFLDKTYSAGNLPQVLFN